jgi:hypothetical protein
VNSCKSRHRKETDERGAVNGRHVDEQEVPCAEGVLHANETRLSRSQELNTHQPLHLIEVLEDDVAIESEPLASTADKP